MRVEVKASLVLVALVAVLSILLEVTGLNKNFILGQLVFLVGAIAINIGVIFWALKSTASESSYGQQLGRSALIGVLGGILIVAVSWFLLSVVFPDSLENLRASALEFMEASGMPEADVQAQLEQIDSTTPMSQSIPGGIGTFFTSLIAGALIGIFQRRK